MNFKIYINHQYFHLSEFLNIKAVKVPHVIPKLSMKPFINPITSSSDYLLLYMDPKIINIDVAKPLVTAKKKVTNIAK